MVRWHFSLINFDLTVIEEYILPSHEPQCAMSDRIKCILNNGQRRKCRTSLCVLLRYNENGFLQVKASLETKE